eukprot:TRINITY_DN19505_c0_g1_i1.p1 TRINITY_DN19505_c0_g1~~TRINITY_DN19505_c0_g1_i1.p1  ORF type:complete len:461 (+),score=123.99 TRINITY_DN19505_c0_g1_i1:53-1435(+)
MPQRAESIDDDAKTEPATPRQLFMDDDPSTPVQSHGGYGYGEGFGVSPKKAISPARPFFDDAYDFESTRMLGLGPSTPIQASNNEINFESMGGISPKKSRHDSPVGDDSEEDSWESVCSRFAEEFIQKGNDIGEGSFGVVSKVQHRLDGHIYAVKRSKEPIGGYEKREKRLQEVYAVASLPRCQHIVKYYDCWIERSYLYIRFEYCEGGNIKNVKSWTYPSLLELFYQISIGLQSLHAQSVVHLDVKAENIYMTYKNGKTIYKLGDFGLVRKVGCKPWPGVNEDEGDSRYLCSMFLNDQKYPKAADVFALAATVYEAARGVDLPGNGAEWQALRKEPARDIEGRYPEEFVKLIKECMDERPETRPACLDILSNPVFDSIKEESGQAAEIRSMEEELRSLRAQLAGANPPSAQTASSSSPGLSPTDSNSPSPLNTVTRTAHYINPVRELPPPRLSQPRALY